VRGLGVVLPDGLVRVERDRGQDLDRRGPDADLEAQRPQDRHVLLVEGAHAARAEAHRERAAVAPHGEDVVHEIELDVEGARAVAER
jgi:hypothetical protein